MSKNIKINSKELKSLDIEELSKKLDDLKKSLFNLRFKKSAGELKNLKLLAFTRRDIARVKTEINNKNNS